MIATFGDVLATCLLVVAKVIGACIAGLALAWGTGRLAALTWSRRQRRAAAAASRAPVTRDDLTAIPALERVTACPEFCGDLTTVGDPGDCRCAAACDRSWCPRKRSPVPVTWDDRQDGVR